MCAPFDESARGGSSWPTCCLSLSAVPRLNLSTEPSPSHSQRFGWPRESRFHRSRSRRMEQPRRLKKKKVDHLMSGRLQIFMAPALDDARRRFVVCLDASALSGCSFVAALCACDAMTGKYVSCRPPPSCSPSHPPAGSDHHVSFTVILIIIRRSPLLSLSTCNPPPFTHAEPSSGASSYQFAIRAAFTSAAVR